MKPNKERIQLLVDALKSGEFKQAQGILRKDNRYCCLGVACAVYKRETGKGVWREVGGSLVYEFVQGSLARSGYLPDPVSKWFGFDNHNPALHANGTTATFMNDIDNKSLAEIGEAFERTYLNANTK